MHRFESDRRLHLFTRIGFLRELDKVGPWIFGFAPFCGGFVWYLLMRAEKLFSLRMLKNIARRVRFSRFFGSWF